jgi:TRAP transporter TAXI family solute receptor
MALGIGLVLVIFITRQEVFPSRTLVMATGPAGDAYAVLAQRFREVLARDGVDLQLRGSQGSIENVALLNDAASGVDVAFEQAGSTNEEESPSLQSLGTMFYEPLWFFCRCEAANRGLEDLPGPRLSIGPPGSGSRARALALLKMAGVPEGRFELSGFSPEEAARRLRAGELDGAAIVSGWGSPTVRDLLADPKFSLLDFPRADAYVALVPFLRKVKVPQGVGNLPANRPPADVYLLASKASLLVRADTHPAHQFLLLRAAKELQAPATIFDAANEFPAAEVVDVPLSDVAQNYYKSGPNFLQRNLPFWLTSFVERTLFLLLPVVGILYPLLRVIPAIYRWEMRHRVIRLYAVLRSIETRARASDSPREIEALMRELEALESRIARAWMPRGFSDTAYTLKLHVQYVRGVVTTAATACERRSQPAV